MRVVTLTGFTPPPRYDGLPFTRAVIEEGPTASGSWTQLADVLLAPADADPANPLTRSFTVENAALTNGWYRVTFKDATGDITGPTAPVQNILLEWTPSLAEVGAILRSRTVTTSGAELGSFSKDTRPSGAEALILIGQAVRDVTLKIGQLTLTPGYVDDARQLAVLRTAMLIELSYYPEQVASNRSPYAQYKELYDSGIESLVAALTVVTAETGASTGSAQYFFPDVSVLVGYDTKM